MKAGSPSADLGRTDELNRRIVDSSRDCIKVLDLEGRLLYLNQAGPELLELCERDDVLYAPWLDFWQGADRQAAADAIARAKVGGTASFRGYCPTARGTPKWWDVVVTPISDAQGAVVQLLAVSRDITAWKHAEQSLGESEQRFRTLFAEAGTGIALLDLAGERPIQSNGALQTMLACSAEALSRLDTFARLTCKEDRTRDARLHGELCDGQRETLRQEKHFVLEDGRHVWANVIFTLLRDPEGRPAQVIAMHEDITERKQAEQAIRASRLALRKSQQRYALAAKAGAVGVWDWNLVTNEIYVDPVLKELLGFEDSEIANRIEEWGQRVLPDDCQVVMAHAQAHIEGRTPSYEVEHRMVHKDGSIRWFLARGAVVRRKESKALRMVGTDTDITDRKRAEAALREKESALAASYQQIQDLAGRLIVAQEAERTRIARDLHDDIGQQLASLSIALSLLKRRLRGAQLEAATSLQQRTSGLAEQIRHLSHDLHPGALQHAGLVAALKDHCAEFEQRHAARITFSAVDDLGFITPEVTLCLYRIVQEALHNIAKHASARSIRVVLTREADALHLIITDDGRGFDSAQMRQPGGGLGLVSIEERARLVRGTVEIDTQPDEGTRLHVRIPCGARNAIAAP